MGIVVRRTAVSAVLAVVALVWCNASARAAGVLDQVPQDAFVVVRVANLEQTSKKIARWAEQLGLAQAVPEFADPLGALEKQLNVKQGLDRTGELAFVFVDPKTVGGNEQEAMLLLVPTKDFKSFTAGLPGVKPGAGGVSTFRPADAQKDSHVAQWGGYAAIGESAAVLKKKPAAPGGFKLSALAASVGSERDILMFANIPALRATALPELEKARAQMMQEIDRGAQGGGPGAAAAGANPEMAKKFAPVIKVLLNQYMNGAKQFLQDADGGMVGISIGDAGLNVTAAADFKQGSYIGDLATKTKNTNADLMAGLPPRKYFAFGGMSLTKEVAQQLFGDIADPIGKELAAVGPDGKAFADAIEAAKGSAGAVDTVSFGYTVPTGALGADSIVQAVTVMKGDAKAIETAAEPDPRRAGKDGRRPARRRRRRREDDVRPAARRQDSRRRQARHVHVQLRDGPERPPGRPGAADNGRSSTAPTAWAGPTARSTRRRSSSCRAALIS
jgi:hypothetical protein